MSRRDDPHVAAEAAALRRSFDPVEMPAGLTARLLAVADVPRAVSSARSRWHRVAAATLVAAAVIVASVIVAAVIGIASLADDRIEELAHLAAVDHVYDRHVTIESADRDELAAALSDAVPFDVVIPFDFETMTLVGGRRCALAGHPIAYTLWQGDDEAASLFQFRPEDHELPREMPGRRVTDISVDGAPEPVDALIWTDKGIGFVLVMDDDLFVPADFK